CTGASRRPANVDTSWPAAPTRRQRRYPRGPEEQPMTTESGTTPVSRTTPWGALPAATSILAVTARPGQEAADLGGLLQAFRQAGANLSLLCLTRGEAGA